MPRSITNILTQQSRRLISSVIVNMGNTICCKKWKSKIAKCQLQFDEMKKVLDCQDEDEETSDSFTPESITNIPIADAIPRKITTEPDWIKRFYKVEDVEEVHDKDPNNLIKEPCPLPFKETKAKDLYDACPKKKP